MTLLEKDLLEKTLFSNELALQSLETSKRLMKLADDDPDYLQAKHNIEVMFEKQDEILHAANIER